MNDINGLGVCLCGVYIIKSGWWDESRCLCFVPPGIRAKREEIRMRGPRLPSGLTPKQEGFARMVAKGSNLTMAYREVYDTGTMADKTVWQEAWTLSRNQKVANMIEALQKANESMDLHDSEKAKAWALERLKAEATSAETDGARIRAVELVMKHHGLLTDKLITKDETELNAVDLRAMLESKLADRLGLLIDHEDILEDSEEDSEDEG